MAEVVRHTAKVIAKATTLSITCNPCGKVRTLAEFGSEMRSEMHRIQASGGYHSNYPADLEVITMDVCDQCLEMWTSRFKHPVDSWFAVSNGSDQQEANHSETGEKYHVNGYWARKVGSSAPWPDDMPEMPEMPDPGVYQHFKGRYYKVVGEVQDIEDGQNYVMYMALYGDNGVFIRPLSMWNDINERDGYKGPRFRFANEDDE